LVTLNEIRAQNEFVIHEVRIIYKLESEITFARDKFDKEP